MAMAYSVVTIPLGATMKKTFILLASLATIGCGSGSSSNGNIQNGSLSGQQPEVPSINDRAAYVRYLQQLAREQGAAWQPGLTENFADPTFNAGAWLGQLQPPVVPNSEEVRPRDLAVESTMPRTFRWDNREGINFMTPVKMQSDPQNQAPPRDFGTCQAFATISCLEARVNILTNNPFAAPDLSEWHIFTRSGRDFSNSAPNRGWAALSNNRGSLEILRDEGAVIEAVFPYSLIPTIPGLTESTFRWRVSNPRRVAPDITAIKQEVLKGPVIATMQVFSDFHTYTGGTYQSLQGQNVGFNDWHAVAIVGWDENDSCWVCRNSWGTNWGERGYFKIKYGQCSIETGGVFTFDMSLSQLPPSTVSYVGRNSADTESVYVTRRASGRREQTASPALGINAELSTKIGLTPDASALTHMNLSPQLANQGLLSSTWNFLARMQILVPDISPASDDLWYHPAWSKDSTKLAFIRETASATHLSIYQLSKLDNNPSYLRNTRTIKTGGRLRGASFSPDGTQVLTSDRLAGPGGTVMVVNVTDGSSRVIKQGNANDLVFAGDRNGWSGRLSTGNSKILYTKVSPGPIYRTYACNPDGSGEQLVREDNFYGEFGWIQGPNTNSAQTLIGRVRGHGYALGRHDDGPSGSFTPLSAFQLPGEPAGQTGAELFLNPNDTNL